MRTKIVPALWLRSRRIVVSGSWRQKRAGKRRFTSDDGRGSSTTADFGFQNVAAQEKEHLVRQVFSRVASKYDVMNDVMSLGTHRLWKDDLVDMLGYKAAARIDPKYVPRHLDVAGGTGDVAFRSVQQLVSNYSSVLKDGSDTNAWQKIIPDADNASEESTQLGMLRDSTKVVVCDINPDMLEVGKLRARNQFSAEDQYLMEFVEGNAETLPFEDCTFDLYTIAFGLRNVTDKEKALREAHRVLKTGGRMLVLEFSHVQNPLISQIYDQFSFQVIPRMGEIVASDADSYQYLVESIRRFPKQEELKQMMDDAGFRNTSYVNFTFGVVAIHSGFKV